MFIEMTVGALNIDPFTNMPFMILRDKSENKKMPIWIGLFEASAIATQLENIKLQRPMTHDLVCLVLGGVQAKLKQVEIYDLKDNTYFARLIVDHAGQAISVDSRPSDAIAVALRMQAPIFVEEQVIEKSQHLEAKLEAQVAGKEQISKDKWREILENLSPEAFGKYKM